MPIMTRFGDVEWDPNRTMRQCAYCPAQLVRSNRTKEDFWPRWMQRKFPHTKGERSSHFVRTSFDGDTTREYGQLGIRRKIPWLCKDCNNCFSSQLQEAARPAIHNALARNIRFFSHSELVSLSRWACLTAMTWEFADLKSKAIGQSTREKFRTSGKTPENMSVWIGSYEGTGFQLNQKKLHQSKIFLSNDPKKLKIGDEIYISSQESITVIGLGSIFPLAYCIENLEDFDFEYEGARKFSPTRAFSPRSDSAGIPLRARF